MTAFFAGPPCVIGKVRQKPEFLRMPRTDRALVEFDGWLTESMEWVARKQAADWPQAFAQGAIHAFVFQPRSLSADEIVCGVLGPSADSAGRQFPLVIAAPIRLSRKLLSLPHLLPFVVESFWSSSSELLTMVLSDPHADAISAVPDLTVQADLSAEEAESLYSEWASELPLTELWELLGGPLEGAEASSALRLFSSALEPFRGVERPHTPLSFKFPLGHAAGAGLCFWIDLVRRSLRWNSTVPSFFWSHDGSWGTALLNLGSPPKSSLAGLFMPHADHDETCDLSRPLAPTLALTLPPLAPSMASTVEDSSSTVSSLLQALG